MSPLIHVPVPIMRRAVAAPAWKPSLLIPPVLALLVALALPGAAIAALAAEPGPAQTGITENPGEALGGLTQNPCPGSTLVQNDDGTFENGYAWQNPSEEPYFHAFAEGYSETGTICGIQAMLTAFPDQYQGAPANWYVWASNGSEPTVVLSVTSGVSPGQPGNWPEVTAHDIAIQDTAVSGPGFFVGYWGDFQGGLAQWFIAADLDGFGGQPRTYIPPGYWIDVSDVWGPTQALGLRAYIAPEPNPSENATWGSIKAIYSRNR